MDCRQERTIDPAYFLMIEFIQGLQGLHDRSLTFEHSREFNRRFAAQQKARRQYCRDCLARLEREEPAAEGEVAIAAIHVARATVRGELARYHCTDQPEAAQELFHEALDDAERSGRPEIIRSALTSLGDYYRMAGTFGGSDTLEHAVWYYKEALVYCRAPMPQYEIPTILYWLGVIYAWQDADLPQAVFMFDWASRFGPLQFNSLVEKQKCRLRMGEREALLQETKLSADPHVTEVAAAVAALQVLGRRQKRLREVALLGIEVAERQDRKWRSVFETLLNAHQGKRPKHGEAEGGAPANSSCPEA
jgi:tetratricopeptide (TPR) repeat protein